MGTTLKEAEAPKPEEPVTDEERERIKHAGQEAKKGDLPRFLNPYRTPLRRAVWDEGFDLG